jgi:hypothetical protein
MTEISANVTLRPTRIGFLVRPTDLKSVRTIMRACACLWGGTYNPIIPVFTKPPREWKPEAFDRVTGAAVAAGYVRFFEPDVYVEAEEGLLEAAGLSGLREEHFIYPTVMTLTEMLKSEQGKTWWEPPFGLPVHDVFAHLYKTEQRFIQRKPRENLLVSAQRGSALTEAVFGFYPTGEDADYIQSAYVDVFEPLKCKPEPATWQKAFMDGGFFPLAATRHGLNAERYWHHELILFVFDPKRPTDLIDLWNLRLEPRPVIPIPVEWFDALADDIFEILKSQHRPIIGNPQGLMHNATIEFARSLSRPRVESLVKSLKPGLPNGALMVKHWRNQIWVEHRDGHVHRDDRMKVSVEERSVELTVNDDEKELRTAFSPIEPEFSSQYGRGDHRWVNVLRVSLYGADRNIASVLPFNTFDRSWPHLGMGHERVAVSSEGWVYPQRYKNSSQWVTLLRTDEAIAGSLKQLGVKAELSEPGRVAKQMLENLEGLWATHLLADLPTLQLLNKMAGGLRKKSNDDGTIEENFGLRTAPLKDWTDLISRRNSSQRFSVLKLEDFTKRNIIRIGLETGCPHCKATNWNTLTSADYRITCERCLKPYDFPQADILEYNRNWTYRVVGPFSVPDYGRGSYSAILALRVLNFFHTSTNKMTFSTAMNFAFDGIEKEVDLVAWRYEDRLAPDKPPRLIIGETKSLGRDAVIKPKDVAKLKAVAQKLPDAVIVVAVLRDHFTEKERRLLRKFVTWGRRLNAYGEPTNPVLLLTSHELFMDHHVSHTWKELGGEHAKFTEYNYTRDLHSFADATQQIYLGFKSFSQWHRELWQARHAWRKAKAKA